MNPALLFLFAILIPVTTAIILFAPAYLAMMGALYIKYGDKILAMKFQVFTVMDTYQQLFSYWWANKATLSIIDYALPIAGLPAVGILITLFFAYKFTMYVRNIFILTS